MWSLSVLIKMSALIWLLHFSTAVTLHLHGGREASCRCTLCRRAVLDFTQQISVNISLSFILYQHTIFIYSCTGFGSVSMRSTYSTATEELHMIIISQKALSFVFESR